MSCSELKKPCNSQKEELLHLLEMKKNFSYERENALSLPSNFLSKRIVEWLENIDTSSCENSFSLGTSIIPKVFTSGVIPSIIGCLSLGIFGSNKHHIVEVDVEENKSGIFAHTLMIPTRVKIDGKTKFGVREHFFVSKPKERDENEFLFYLRREFLQILQFIFKEESTLSFSLTYDEDENYRKDVVLVCIDQIGDLKPSGERIFYDGMYSSSLEESSIYRDEMIKGGIFYFIKFLFIPKKNIISEDEIEEENEKKEVNRRIRYLQRLLYPKKKITDELILSKRRKMLSVYESEISQFGNFISEEKMLLLKEFIPEKITKAYSDILKYN